MDKLQHRQDHGDGFGLFLLLHDGSYRGKNLRYRIWEALTRVLLTREDMAMIEARISIDRMPKWLAKRRSESSLGPHLLYLADEEED